MILVVLVAICLIILVILKRNEKNKENNSQKLKKWLNVLFISVIVFLICVVLNKFITMASTIFTIGLYVSGAVAIISLMGSTIISIKDKEKLPVWASLLQGILIVVIVGGIIAKIIDYNRIQEDKKNINEYNENIFNANSSMEEKQQNADVVEQPDEEKKKEEFEKAKLAAKEYALSKLGNEYDYIVSGNSESDSNGVYNITVHVEEPYYGGGSTSVGYFSIKVKDGYVISANYN